MTSGNVFADLGFDNSEEELPKAKLAREIRAIIMRRRLTQAKSAQLLVMKQLDISAIVTGRTDKFSIDRQVRCLDRRDNKVDVVARHEPRKPYGRPQKQPNHWRKRFSCNMSGLSSKDPETYRLGPDPAERPVRLLHEKAQVPMREIFPPAFVQRPRTAEADLLRCAQNEVGRLRSQCASSVQEPIDRGNTYARGFRQIGDRWPVH